MVLRRLGGQDSKRAKKETQLSMRERFKKYKTRHSYQSQNVLFLFIRSSIDSCVSFCIIKHFIARSGIDSSVSFCYKQYV